MHGIRHDIGSRVAATHNQHTPVAHLTRALVGPRVDDLPREGAWIVRHPRRVVVPAGDHDPAIDAGLRLAGDRDRPCPVRQRRHCRDRLAELDVVE